MLHAQKDLILLRYHYKSFIPSRLCHISVHAHQLRGGGRRKRVDVGGEERGVKKKKRKSKKINLSCVPPNEHQQCVHLTASWHEALTLQPEETDN